MAKKKVQIKRNAAQKRKVKYAGAGASCETPAGNGSCRALFALILLFTLMAFAISTGIIAGNAIYTMLVIAAAGFLLFEAYIHRSEPDRIMKAVYIGIFLMAFDFVFQNAGWMLGLWQTFDAAIVIGVVPIEIMLVCLLGGAAWALYLPKRYDRIHTLMDVLTFGVYGAFGEFMLIGAGLMAYYQWWNSWLAFASYALVWVLLHYMRYKIVKV